MAFVVFLKYIFFFFFFFCKRRNVRSVSIVILEITRLIWRNPLIPGSFNQSEVWRSQPGFSGDLKPIDIQDRSMTPPGSHLSGERALSCIPWATTGHLHWSSSWTEEWMGMLVVRTMVILLTVVFFWDALTPPFFPPCCAQPQVHLTGPFGVERPYASTLTLFTGGHRSTSMCRGWLQFKSRLLQKTSKQTKQNKKTKRN